MEIIKNHENENMGSLESMKESTSETLYREIASLHVGHSLKNRPYDNFLFHKIIENIGNTKEKIILEFGCGHGHYAVFLEQKGINIYGVDIDENAIATANFNSNKKGKFIALGKEENNSVSNLGIKFDAVYSMYVYETIKDKTTIAKIFADIFAVTKEGGSFQFIIGNIEEFYGKKCVEFEFPKNPLLKKLEDGDPYIARLITENGFFDVQDFYHSQEILVEMIKTAGFQEIFILKYPLNGDEYDNMEDEKEHIPSVIFMAKK